MRLLVRENSSDKNDFNSVGNTLNRNAEMDTGDCKAIPFDCHSTSLCICFRIEKENIRYITCLVYLSNPKICVK